MRRTDKRVDLLLPPDKRERAEQERLEAQAGRAFGSLYTESVCVSDGIQFGGERGCEARRTWESKRQQEEERRGEGRAGGSCWSDEKKARSVSISSCSKKRSSRRRYIRLGKGEEGRRGREEGREGGRRGELDETSFEFGFLPRHPEGRFHSEMIRVGKLDANKS